jgi:hypothetical protein
VSWLYQQNDGRLFNVLGNPVATGYSGSPEGKNDPSKQNIKDVGPIPQGWYTIGAPYNSVTHGPYAMPLFPDPSNQMFGRAGFLIHGDSLESPGCASEGCVIFDRETRGKIWSSGDHRLEVVAGIVS